MYSRVRKIAPSNPDFLLIHVATNDSIKKTSDEMLFELEELTNFVNKILPGTQVIISTPIILADYIMAKNRIINHNEKLKKSQLRILDNSNLNISHLGRKGLHFSNHGTKKMAVNLISLIRRL